MKNKNSRVTFDVYQKVNSEYSIYLVSESDDWSSNSKLNTLYRHDIKYNGWREDKLEDMTSLS